MAPAQGAAICRAGIRAGIRLVGQHALRPRPFNHRAEPRAFGAMGRRGMDAVDKACFVGAGEGLAAQRAF